MLIRYLLSAASLVASVRAACGVPVLVAPTNGAALTNSRVSHSAYSTDPACRKIFLWYDGSIISYQQLDGVGPSFSMTGSDLLRDGTHTMYVSVTGPDANGQDLPQVASAPITFTIDTRHKCGVPVLTAPTNGASLTNSRVSHSAYTTDAACPKLFLWYDGKIISYQTLGGAGPSFPMTGSDLLQDGTHTMYVSVTGPDANGQDLPQVASAPITFTIDTRHRCGVPVLTAPTNGASLTNSRVSHSAYTTDAACPKLFLWYDGKIISYQTLGGAGPSFPMTGSDLLQDGTHTMYVSVTGPDANGQDLPQVASAPITFTIDTRHKCGVPVLTAPTNGAALTDSRVSHSAYTTDASCAKLFLWLDGKIISYQTLAGAGPSFPMTGSDLLTDGTHTMYVSVTGPDASGQDLPQVASAPITFTIDTRHKCGVPVLTAPTDGAALTDSRVSHSAYTTDAACPKIFLWYDGKIISYQTLGGAGPSFPMTGSDLLQDGTHTMYVSVTGPDANGNDLPQVASAPITFTIDTTHKCNIPVLTSPADGAAFTDSRVYTSGYTTDPLCKRTLVNLDGQVIGYDDLVGAGAANGFSRSDLLKDGSHTMFIIAAGADADGKQYYTAQSAPITFIIDTTHKCGVPILTSPADGAVYTDSRVTTSGYTTDPLCKRTLVNLDGQVIGYDDLIGAGAANGFSRSDLLKDGTHTMYIIAAGADADGKQYPTAQTSPITFTVNTAVPCAAPVILTPRVDTAQAGRQLFITGTFAGTEACPKVALSINGVYQGLVGTSGTNWEFYPLVDADGVYTISVVGKSSEAAELDSAPTTRDVTVNQGVCPQPVLTLPVAGQTQSDRFIEIRGTIARPADCPYVALYINGVNVASATMDGSNFYSNILVEEDGPHEVYAQSKSNVAQIYDSDLTAADRHTVTISPAPPTVCPAPVLTSPVDNSAQNGQSITITGTATGSRVCPDIHVAVDGGYPRAVVIQPDNTFSTTWQVTSEGAHSVTAFTQSSQSDSLNSPVVSAAVRIYAEPCPAPVLISPKAGETSTTQIYFSGTLDNRPECGKIEVYMDGNLIYSTATSTAAGPRRKRELVTFDFNVPTASLPPGPHNIYAVVTGDNNGVQTAPVPITVANNAATPTGGMRKRERCTSAQTICPFKSSGRIGFECVDDIQNNIERCGACDGPDCTEILHASHVACVQAQCIVSQCMEGYLLVDNACTPGWGPLVVQE
ncbi:uncharacterized protein MKK02DRAFT_43818 [Dioszegia hungarica]|uniref:Protein CPL1-like domain-containing protein n=1 Tax=Dioszegia hungarica TaxID=4972 RepID=A0AA38H6Q0_9TREE|nr:uncharacterized protein MKK02DRAFT_43818 [Dioszegia hungarica]KAI9635140.1 hypothetical protein MKK02DRAFT_43818 [Dioszegia hungarica]